MTTKSAQDRRYARVRARLRARFRVIDSMSAATLEEELLAAASVWSPRGESELVKLAGGPEGLMATAILDISRQIQRLSYRILDSDGPMEVGELDELSGGGAKLRSKAIFEKGTLLDMRLVDEDPEAPPIHMLAEVIHVRGGPPAVYGICFRGIHPLDKERLIRFIYGLQRRELRKTHTQES